MDNKNLFIALLAITVTHAGIASEPEGKLAESVQSPTSERQRPRFNFGGLKKALEASTKAVSAFTTPESIHSNSPVVVQNQISKSSPKMSPKIVPVRQVSDTPDSEVASKTALISPASEVSYSEFSMGSPSNMQSPLRNLSRFSPGSSMCPSESITSPPMLRTASAPAPCDMSSSLDTPALHRPIGQSVTKKYPTGMGTIIINTFLELEKMGSNWACNFGKK